MAPKQSTRPRTAAQPNDAEKKVQCGTCNSDSWIFAHKWTPGRTCRFCCSPFPKPVARAQSVGKRAAVDAGSAPAGGVEPWLREILQEKLDVAERAGDEGAVKKIRALCPELVSKDRGDGGVDLWISLTKQMQQLQQQQLQLVEAAVRHKHKAAEQEERAIEIGKSISQIRRRLTNTAKESEAKVLDEKSLDFADDETKKAYQDALKLERAAAKRVAEIAEAARTMQMERKRAAQTEACVAMEEDTKMPASKEQDDEVKQLLAKVSKEAEQRAYLSGPAAEPKDPKPEDKGKPCSWHT